MSDEIFLTDPDCRSPQISARPDGRCHHFILVFRLEFKILFAFGSINYRGFLKNFPRLFSLNFFFPSINCFFDFNTCKVRLGLYAGFSSFPQIRPVNFFHGRLPIRIISLCIHQTAAFRFRNMIPEFTGSINPQLNCIFYVF